jgi:hypothetical protein
MRSWPSGVTGESLRSGRGRGQCLDQLHADQWYQEPTQRRADSAEQHKPRISKRITELAADALGALGAAVVERYERRKACAFRLRRVGLRHQVETRQCAEQTDAADVGR